MSTLITEFVISVVRSPIATNRSERVTFDVAICLNVILRVLRLKSVNRVNGLSLPLVVFDRLKRRRSLSSFS